jgi:hypothetical protein
MRTKLSSKKTTSRGAGAKSRRRKKPARRIGAVRAVPKPATRAEQIAWAENLGFEALCDVRGGAGSAIRGASATHGGAVQVAGCCGWNRYVKGGACGGGTPPIVPGGGGPKLA